MKSAYGTVPLICVPYNCVSLKKWPCFLYIQMTNKIGHKYRKPGDLFYKKGHNYREGTINKEYFRWRF